MTAVELKKRLLNAVLADGGWGYYAGQPSRLEPTAWATLALCAGATPIEAGARCTAATTLWAPLQNSKHLIVEKQSAVSNFGFNGLALLALTAAGATSQDPLVSSLTAGLLEARGIQIPDAGTAIKQNTMLQAWSWIDGTFSWSEPTAWCLTALKKTGTRSGQRIADGEAMLLDRVCQNGGWNYGNSNAFTQDLRPYVPTTALGLISLQTRRADAAVTKSLAWLEAHALTEASAMALSLAAIALSVYDRPTDTVLAALDAQESKTGSLGNAHLMAMTLYALTIPAHQARAFRI